MKKILHVNTTMNIGGIEAFLMNVFENIDKEKYEFTFLCYNNDIFDYESRINNLGGKIIRISDPKIIGKKKHYREILEVLSKYSFDVVHCHTYFDSAIVLKAAKKKEIKIRICHSHTTEGNNRVSLLRKIKWLIGSIMINYYSTVKLACSPEAGLALYKSNNFSVLHNGIDINKFKYDENKRCEIRTKYNISDEDIVIGHVGRFELAKNHEFLIRLIKRLNEKDKKYKLMLIGDGSLFQKINNLSLEEEIKNQIIFVGGTVNSNLYYNAFDLFVFPSIYEGLGISLIEAQTNGLNCIASINVPNESKIIKEVTFLELNLKNWEEQIKKQPQKRNIESFETIKKSSYNIKNTVKQLEKIYNK